MRPAVKVALAFMVLFLAFFAYVVLRALSALATVSHHEPTLAPLIETACLSYMTEYNRLPPSSDNQKLTAALMGDNSRHIAFMSLSKNQMNANGEIVDPWGTPFRVNFQPASGVQVISAGPDKRFDTPDDIVVNSPDNHSNH